jgi:hypothetical protein
MWHLAVLTTVLHFAVAQDASAKKGPLSANLQLDLQDDAGVNPIRKVVGMLEDMGREIEREMDEEKELFEKALCACKVANSDLTKTISDATAAISHLTAKITEETAEDSSLKEELKEHHSNKVDVENDLDKATKLREKETKKFHEQYTMNEFSVNALKKALPALEGGASSSALMQQQDSPQLRRIVEVSRYLTADNRDSVLAFMDDGLGGSSMAPPSSSEVVGILKSMLDHMVADMKQSKKDEEVAAVGYKDLKAAKDEELSVANSAIAVKEKRTGELAVSISESKDSLEDNQDELAIAQKYLTVVTEMCSKKEQERDTRAKMRTDELSAISEAINILNEDDALDVFKKAVPSASLLKARSKTYEAALLQSVGSSQFTKDLAKARNIVVGLVKKHPSNPKLGLLLNTLNTQVRQGLAAPDAAAEAKNVMSGMIDGMVGVLHDEEVEDAHKKEFCANETEKGTALKQGKQEAVDALQSSIEQMTDELEQTAQDIKGLEESIQMTNREVALATEQRKKEHQEFVDSLATSDTARRLIDKAATRLAKFYSPKAHAAAAKAKASLLKVTPTLPPPAAAQRMAAEFDSFVQKHGKESGSEHVAPPIIPETPSGPVKSQESGGIVGILMKLKEEITADMAEAETEEKFSAKDYTRVMKEAKETHGQDTKSLTTKKNIKAELEVKLTEAKEARATTMKELENINLYMVQLHTECDFLLRNFEARHEGRVQEAVGLKSAESVLTGEEVESADAVEASFGGPTASQPAQAEPATVEAPAAEE